jgi:inorganic pyrophosphatase
MKDWLIKNPTRTPTYNEKRQIAHAANLTVRQVYRWFHYENFKKSISGNILTKLHKKVLKNFFIFNNKPNLKEIETLAFLTNQNPSRIKYWFQVRRKYQKIIQTVKD